MRATGATPPWPWWLAWLGASLVGGAAITGVALARLEEAFLTDARIAHRLLSQQAVQHEAVLNMLALLQPEAPAQVPAARLPALYPQLLRVLHRTGDAPWPEGPRAVLAATEAVSRQQGHAASGPLMAGPEHTWLVLGRGDNAHALQLDVRAMVPRTEWPWTDGGPVHAQLVAGDRQVVLADGRHTNTLHRWAFQKVLAAPSQPYTLVASRSVGWVDLPWWGLLAWVLACAGATAWAQQQVAQRRAHRRAQALLRLGQTSRLNTLGELAAGLAHELNQPLTAVVANTQAANRLLAEDPVDWPTARHAMDQAVAQAKRAAAVLGRLRASLARSSGDTPPPDRPVALAQVVGKVLELLEPECQQLGVVPGLEGPRGLAMTTDAVALEQILHNLLTNALHALGEVPANERVLRIAWAPTPSGATIAVMDTGPGVPPDQVDQLFQPFFTTKAQGLGLGLSLCATLATALGGRLAHQPHPSRGSVFTLTLSPQDTP